MSSINWNGVGFSKNPFNIVPDIEQEDIIWAGFEKNKQRFDSIIRDSLVSNDTNLILNLSRWGGGKTHAAVFYSKEKNLPNIENHFTLPFNIFVVTPKEGNYGAHELYVKLIDSFKLDLISSTVKFFRTTEGEDASLKIFKDWAGSEDIGRIIWFLGDKNEDNSFGAEQLIFGQGTATLRSKLRIRRPISTISDKFQILSALIKLFSKYSDKEKFENPRRVFLWIDELESLIFYTSKQFRPFTQAIRSLIDMTPTYLSIILNFSFAEPNDIQNIEFVIGSALLDRVTEKVIFDEASIDESIIYIEQLFKFYRTPNFKSEGLFPFNKEALKVIFKNAPSQTGLPLMPRTINKWCLSCIKEAYDNGFFKSNNIQIIDEEFASKINFVSMSN